MAWYLHACAVCGGDLSDELADERGYVKCLQCSRAVRIEAPVMQLKESSNSPVAVVAVAAAKQGGRAM